jgi:hypothetical protein
MHDALLVGSDADAPRVGFGEYGEAILGAAGVSKRLHLTWYLVQLAHGWFSSHCLDEYACAIGWQETKLSYLHPSSLALSAAAARLFRT